MLGYTSGATVPADRLCKWAAVKVVEFLGGESTPSNQYMTGPFGSCPA